MPRLILRLLLFLIWTNVPALAADSITLILKNGDRFSGVILSENANRVVLQSTIAGKLKIPLDQIAIREKPLVDKPASAQPSTAAVIPPAKSTPPVKTTGTPSLTPGPSPAETTNLLSQTWLQTYMPDLLDPFMTNWHGGIQIGLDLGYGTTDRQTYYANGNSTHSYGRLRNFADLHAAYGFLNKVQSAERIDGSWKLDVDLGSRRRIYIYNQIGASYDRIRKLDRQYNEGVGFGSKILQKPKMNLRGEAGGQYQLMDYAPDSLLADRHIVSIRFGEAFAWTISNKFTVNQKVSFVPNLQEFDDFRMRFELGLSYPLLKRMTINLNFFNEYDSSPPPGVDSNDLQLQSTLGISF